MERYMDDSFILLSSARTFTHSLYSGWFFLNRLQGIVAQWTWNRHAFKEAIVASLVNMCILSQFILHLIHFSIPFERYANNYAFFFLSFFGWLFLKLHVDSNTWHVKIRLWLNSYSIHAHFTWSPCDYQHVFIRWSVRIIREKKDSPWLK